MTKLQRISCLIMCYIMLGLTAVVWYRYDKSIQTYEPKPPTISNEQKDITVSHLEPLSLIVVDTKVRVSCYVDTGTMASGKQTYKGAVAVSNRSIPMGTKIYLEEFGEMTVEDKTAKWVDTKFELSTIDVWMTEQECKEFGLKTLSYVIIKQL